MRRSAPLRIADRLSLAGIGLGVALAMQPWWEGGLRAGFYLTAGATLAQIVAARRLYGEPS